MGTPIWKRHRTILSAVAQMARRQVRYSWAIAVIQGTCLIAASYWLQRPPSSGVTVVVLGVVAVVMTVRAEDKWERLERIGWLFLTGVLALVAIRAINQEDYRRDQEFTSILTGLADGIRSSNQQFQATMAKENSILDTTKTAADLSKENLASMSGEDSYPCIVPQSHAVVNGMVPLVVWGRGPNNLTGVEVRLLSQREFLDGGSLFYKPPTELGTLRSEWPKPLPEGVIPTPGDDGVAHYIAEIWTQNGYYTEVINFRRAKYVLPWAYQYWLNKQFGFPLGQQVKTEEQIKSAFKQEQKIAKACGQSSWSDDLGDGKPVPKPQ